MVLPVPVVRTEQTAVTEQPVPPDQAVRMARTEAMEQPAQVVQTERTAVTVPPVPPAQAVRTGAMARQVQPARAVRMVLPVPVVRTE